eukprot:1150546-Pelagomonas_calceolata.AAC.1
MEAQHYRKQQEALDWHCIAGGFSIAAVVYIQEWRGALQGGTCVRTPVNMFMHARIGVSTCVWVCTRALGYVRAHMHA